MTNVGYHCKRVKLTDGGLSRFGRQYQNKPLRIVDFFHGFQILDIDLDEKDCDVVLYQLYDRAVNIEGQPSLDAIRCSEFSSVLYGYLDTMTVDRATVENPHIDFEVIDTLHCCDPSCDERAVVQRPMLYCLTHLIVYTQTTLFKNVRSSPSLDAEKFFAKHGKYPSKCHLCDTTNVHILQLLYGNTDEQFLCARHFISRIFFLSLELTGEKISIPQPLLDEFVGAKGDFYSEFLELIKEWNTVSPPVLPRHIQAPTTEASNMVDAWRTVHEILLSLELKISKGLYDDIFYRRREKEREKNTFIQEHSLLKDFFQHTEMSEILPDFCTIPPSRNSLARIIRWVFYKYPAKYYKSKHLVGQTGRNKKTFYKRDLTTIYDSIFPNVKNGYTSRIDNSFTEFSLYHTSLGSFFEKELKKNGHSVKITLECDFLYSSDIEYNRTQKIFYTVMCEGRKSKIDILRIDSTQGRENPESLLEFLEKCIENLMLIVKHQ